MNISRTWIMRVLAAVAVGAVALGAMACNDDKESLTLEEYFQQVDALDNSSTERIDAVFNGITDEGDVQQFRDAFKAFAPILEEVADELDDLNPPDEAKDEHDAAAKALKDFASKATEVAGGVDDIDASTPDEFFTKVNEQGFTEASDAFAAACMDLQKLADDNSIAVDLDCEDEDEAVAAVEETVNAAIAAWNAKDVDAFVAVWTDQAILAEFGEPDQPLEQVTAGLAEFIGEQSIGNQHLIAEVSDTTATVDAEWTYGAVLEHHELTLVNDAGSWKISSDEQVAVEIPAGTTAVNVDLSEFAFGFVADDIPGTAAFAFKGNNVGTQLHEIALAKIPADADIQELLMSEEDVPGFEFLGATGEIAAGETGSLVLVDPLESGRYLMVCFFGDTAGDQAPHAFKGMTAEFTIP